jgi:hypothetical protein
VAAKIEGGNLPTLNYERGAEESKARFKRRMYMDLPAAGPLRVVTFTPRADPPKPPDFSTN